MKKLLIAVIMLSIAVLPVISRGSAEVPVRAPVPDDPVYGGRLIMAIETEPSSIDPHLVQSNLVTSIVDLCYDYLWRWNYDFSDFDPKLAEDWEWIDDNALHVKLRQGVLFHNGREMVSSDVKYTVDRILNPATGSPLRGFLQPVNDIEIIDNYNFIINIDGPWFGLFNVFSRWVPIVAKEAVEEYGDLGRRTIGTGPFKLSQWGEGYEVRFDRFDGYWDEGKPYLDGVTLRFIREYSSAKNALLAGEIDIINWPDTADIDSLEANPNLALHFYDVMAPMWVFINTSRPPLDDPDVRRAIALASNREAYNQALYRGRGSHGFSAIPPYQRYYSEDWEYERDVEKAKQLLADAGYPDGFDIDILALVGSEEIMGEVLQSDLRDIGVRGTINIEEIPVALDYIYGRGDFDLAVLGTAISPDPDTYASRFFHPAGGGNISTGFWRNDRAIELIEKGRAALDVAERISIYQELYDIVYDETVSVFVAWAVRHPVSNHDVQDWFSWSDIRYDWTSVWLNR